MLSSEISINTLDFTAYSEDDEFNIINPKGFYRLLQQRQKLEVREKFIKDNKEKEMGTFYLDTWKSEKDKAMSISAIDLIGIMDKTDFMGGMYKDIPFIEVIKEIFSSASIEEKEYEVEESLKSILMTGYIPVCSHREALQQAVFAIGAVADCSRSEKIKIYTIKNSQNRIVIEKDNIFQGTKTIEQNEIVSGVEVISHNFISSEVEEEIARQELDVGDNKVIFSEPITSIVCSGGIIKKSNCNYAIITCTETTEVIIKGCKYIDTLRTHLIKVENLNDSIKQHTLKIENAFLINKNNAEEIGKRVLAYYQSTYEVNLEHLLQDEVLAEEVEIESNFEQKLTGYISKIDVDLTGGFISNTKLNAKVDGGV